MHADNRFTHGFVAGTAMCLLLFGFARCSHAAPNSGWRVDEVFVHTFTRHSHGNEYLNDKNWGQGVVLENGLVIGAYRNSIRQNSQYIGWYWRPSPYVGVIYGAISGYLRDDRKIPFAAVVLTAPLGRHWRVHLNVVPAGRQNVANLSIGYTWR